MANSEKGQNAKFPTWQINQIYSIAADAIHTWCSLFGFILWSSVESTWEIY